MKKLVIAEKPSVGREIARNLGCFDRSQGYIEGQDWIVTWALGHLVELAPPQHYSAAWKRWSIRDLPMLPETLEESVIDESKEQFDIISSLLSRSDVESVVIATDAGREGELVARWILKLNDYKGKMERLWISSQTEKAIKEGFSSLHPSSEYDNLYAAAECRADADWYVGMNVTRALTCHHDAKLSAGRVQTPTLALMTKREDEIEAFLGSYYYSARGDFGLFAASYYPEENSIRFTDDKKAEELKEKKDRSGKVKRIESLEKRDSVPLLYDLTELFRIFADSTRVRILYVLFESEMCVCDIAALLGMTQSAISHQLRALKNARLVKSRRDGKTVFYSLADEHVKTILDQGIEHVTE